VVVMPDTEVELAYSIAERLRKSIETTPVIISRQPGQLPVTVSMGIAGSDGTNESADALLRRADQALYNAKNSGRNRVVKAAA